MKVKLVFTAGIFGIAVIAGVFQALNAPRRKMDKACSGGGEEYHKETSTDLTEQRK